MRNQIILLWIAILLLLGASIFAVMEGVQQHNQIQDSRLASCQDTNNRHDAAITFLKNLDKRLDKGATPAQVRSNAIGLGEFETLVNALAPKRNCKAIVK